MLKKIVSFFCLVIAILLLFFSSIFFIFCITDSSGDGKNGIGFCIFVAVVGLMFIWLWKRSKGKKSRKHASGEPKSHINDKETLGLSDNSVDPQNYFEKGELVPRPNHSSPTPIDRTENISSFRSSTNTIKSDNHSNESHSATTRIGNHNWNVMITFGKSSSPMLTRALYLAKNAYSYEEHDIDGQMVYQATFTAEPQSFLQFVQLYELTSNWKSVAVFINGEMMNTKTLNGIIRCYGEKCRTLDNRYCFGGQHQYFSNPFGCHRLSLYSYSKSWFTFSKKIGKYYQIDKKAIAEIIDQYSIQFQYCPSFNYENIMKNLDKLPCRLTEQEMNKLDPYRQYRL